MATEHGPRNFKQMGTSVDGQDFFTPDHVYCINMLLRMGAYPQLRYIDSYKPVGDGSTRLVRWAFISWEPV